MLKRCVLLKDIGNKLSVRKSKERQEIARNSAAFFYRLQNILKDKFGDGMLFRLIDTIDIDQTKELLNIKPRLSLREQYRYEQSKLLYIATCLLKGWENLQNWTH